MRRLTAIAVYASALLLAAPAWADVIGGPVARQGINPVAIAMFAAFVLVSLGITVWAARRGTGSAKSFYAAGGELGGWQNGLAIAGDYTSAATFLGVTALVYSSGYDGMIYAIGFLVGFPMILFLIAEPLRNLGRYTFADVVAYRLQERPIRILAGVEHAGDRGVLPGRADGGRGQADPAAVRSALRRSRRHRRHADDPLRHVRRHAGDHLGPADQGAPAAVRDGDDLARHHVRTSASRSRRCSARRSACIRAMRRSWRPAGWSRTPSRRSRSASR